MSPSSLPPQSQAESKQDSVLQLLATNTATAQAPEQQQHKPALYYYEYATEERLRAWVDRGKKEVLEIGVTARNAQDAITLGILYQELVRSGLDGRIDAAEAGSTIKDIIKKDDNTDTSDTMADDLPFDASSLFLDCLSILTEASPSLATPPLKTLILATAIPAQQMRRELDSTLLESLGLIRNTFVRVGIRNTTNLLYRQSNYNLLREETEGYSKLMTELFTTSSNELPTSEVVEETFERVKGMIGAFDLDVGRVLDITLDVFAAVLVKQYRFFVKYLRASSWWPQDNYFKSNPTGHFLSPLPKWALPGASGWGLSDEEKEDVATAKIERDKAFWQRSKEVGMGAYFEIGDRRAEGSALATGAANSSSKDSSQDDEDRKWIEITNTLPPPGNQVAAQVLGFKLRFYSSTARDPNDVLPVNLIYLAALLIKVGFISLRDLYPHIWPADPAMEGVKEEKMKEKAEKEKLNRPGGGATNALMAAAPLPDDSVDGKIKEATRLRELEAVRRNTAKIDLATERSTPVVQPEEKAEELPEPSEQKVQLLKSLLCIGALPEALYMLGRFPWLPDAFPELPEHIHRILHHSINKVYELLRPLKDQVGLREQQKIPDPDQAGAAKGEVKLIDPPARKTMRWAQLDKEDTNEAIDYKFYWDDWADNIPVCQTVDDVFVLCSTLLNYTGVKIGQDSSLLIKLARIGSHSLATDTSDTNNARWIDLSKRLLVPALSFTKCNPGVVNEVFELIKNFSTPTRYSIYAEWYQGQTSRSPDIKSAFDQAKAETKDVLKRISKTTIKPMARALAKVAYASPGIVFSVAIAQLESYENIVDAVVECARYFTYLAYDVLTWSLMSSLGGTGRNRVQADGMLTSKWLAALSLFAGKVFKRYSVMNPTPIVQYVADQLRKGNSTDLIILEEITKSMAGILSDANLNDAQVWAMAGRDLLQAQTILQLHDRRHESKTTAKRLMKSLTDSRMAGQIIVSLAQERQTGIFRIEEQNAHPKLLGNLFDQLHRILTQYIELLRSNMSVKDFDNYVPGVSELVTAFGVEPSVAFWISRPSIAAAIADYDAKHGKRTSDAKKPSLKGMKEDAAKTDDGVLGEETATDAAKIAVEDQMDVSAAAVNGDSDKENNDLEMKDENDSTPADASPLLPKVKPIQSPWHPVLQGLMEAVRPALPEETWETLSQPFYVTFWQLSLPDMHVPLPSYNDEINRLKKKILAISSDRSDISMLGTQKKDREKKALGELQDRLRDESGTCVQVYQQMRMRLQKEKEHWFVGLWGKWDALNVALIEHCFFPRIVLSPVDAMYTFKMLKYLHSSGTTNFRTMGVYDQFFREKRLTSMMFLCTAKEAECLGRFFNEILRDLSRWHAEKSTFEREAFGPNKNLPGFSKKMTNDKGIVSFYEYEEFRRVLLKWHRNLNGALKTCISSGEYMHIRNAINVLNNVHQYFPAVNWMGQSQLTSIGELSKSETREDLKVAATSLIGALKRREKDWVLPQAFNLTEGGSATNNGVRSTSAKPSTPRPESDTSRTLNPKAPDFHPSPHPIVNGAPKMVRTASGKLEVEDGEIEDAKVTENSFNEDKSSSAQQLPKPASAETPKASAISVPPAETSNRLDISRRDSPAPIANQALRPSAAASSAPTRPEIRATPPATQSSIPNRPDLSRNAPSNTTNGAVQHGLPNKPEANASRAGDYRMPQRSEGRGLHDHAREPRLSERGGADRSRDILRDRGSERSVSSSYSQSHERANERASLVDRERGDLRHGNEKAPLNRAAVDDRHNGSHSRDARQPSRDDRLDRPSSDRLFAEQQHNRREAETTTQSVRDTAMPPPRSNIPQHPDRAALIQGNQNAGRGLPTSNPPDRRSEPPRHDSHLHSGRNSRGPSPKRDDDRRIPRDDYFREERPPVDGRRPVDDPSRLGQPRYEEPHAPTGPRTGRPPSAVSANPTDWFRDSKASTLPPAIDPNHGRLSHDSTHSGRQSESQYGRLNSSTDIPSGPRLANGNHPPQNRGGRNVSAPHPHLNTQQPLPVSQSSTPAAPAQDRQTPSGPSIRGSPRKPPPFNQPISTSSAPPTPVAQSSETGGIHPDRLKAMQGSGAATAESAPANQGQRQAPPPMALPAPGPPRGPNNHLHSPITQSPTNRGPPTGPSFPNDRNRDKRFVGLQNVLQQAGSPTVPERSGQGASIRGRGGRANNVSMPSPIAPGPPIPNPPRQDGPAARGDLFAGRPNGPSNPQQSEADTGYDRGGRRGGPRDDGERRSGRHRSRSPKDRAPAASVRSREDEALYGRDGTGERSRPNDAQAERDLRGGGGQLEKNIRGGAGLERRDTRADEPPRDMRRSGREEGQYRDRRVELDQRDGGDRRDGRDRRDGGGSGRKRGRGGDEGQGERGFAENKRPRR